MPDDILGYVSELWTWTCVCRMAASQPPGPLLPSRLQNQRSVFPRVWPASHYTPACLWAGVGGDTAWNNIEWPSEKVTCFSIIFQILRIRSRKRSQAGTDGSSTVMSYLQIHCFWNHVLASNGWWIHLGNQVRYFQNIRNRMENVHSTLSVVRVSTFFITCFIFMCVCTTMLALFLMFWSCFLSEVQLTYSVVLMSVV